MTKLMGKAVILGCAALVLAACQTKPASFVAETIQAVAATENTLQGWDRLRGILDKIVEDVYPGTAGSTLSAVPYTADLLDWCRDAAVKESELRQAIAQWLQGKDQGEISRKFDLIRDTYELLMGPKAPDLLDSSGWQTDSYPWPESCRQVMETILNSAGA